MADPFFPRDTFPVFFYYTASLHQWGKLACPQTMGIIFPQNIARIMNFHIEEVIELYINKKKKRLIVKRKKQSLRDNLLEGIKASQEENLAFANDFDELEGEI